MVFIHLGLSLELFTHTFDASDIDPAQGASSWASRDLKLNGSVHLPTSSTRVRLKVTRTLAAAPNVVENANRKKRWR